MPRPKKKSRIQTFDSDDKKTTHSESLQHFNGTTDHLKEVTIRLPALGEQVEATFCGIDENQWTMNIEGGMGESCGDIETAKEEPGKLKVKPKYKHYLDSDAPLLTWAQLHRDEYLDWNLVTKGRGRHFDGSCMHCGCLTAEFRCMDCFGLCMSCKKCIVEKHEDEPLHILQEWKDNFFQPTTLQELGVRLQLGHGPRKRCPFPKAAHRDFMVLAWNAPHLQLMEFGWWPSSYKDPCSAAMFSLLRHFHITNLQCQTPASDFCEALQLFSDGSGLLDQPEREAQFMIMLRQWRHIKTVKRVGRGHDTSGIIGTKHGECTVPCRACPDPEQNLPPGWENASVDD